MFEPAPFAHEHVFGLFSLSKFRSQYIIAFSNLRSVKRKRVTQGALNPPHRRVHMCFQRKSPLLGAGPRTGAASTAHAELDTGGSEKGGSDNQLDILGLVKTRVDSRTPTNAVSKE